MDHEPKPAAASQLPDPETLKQILEHLVKANVTQARFGDIELVLTPEVK